MADKESNVVLNFKMDGQIEYAKTIRDINAIMNAAASEYRTHVAAMGKDADATQKLAAEKQKLEIQMEAAAERTAMLRTEYEAMANDTNTSTGALANKYKQLQNSERAELALESALERVNEGLSEQEIESRKAEEALNKLESESDQLESQTEKLNAEYELQKAQLGDNASEADKLNLQMEHLNDTHELAGQKVENYEQQLEQAKLQYGENSTEVDKYEVQLLEARTAEQELANEIEATNKQLQEQESALDKAATKLDENGKKMKDAGKTWTKGITVPIVAAGTAAFMAADEIDKANNEIQQSTGKTGEELEKLKESFSNVFVDVPDEAESVAEVLSSLHVTTDETGEGLEMLTEKTLNYARVNKEDASDSAQTLGRLMNALEVDVDAMPSVMDKMTKAAQMSGIGVNDLSEYIIDAGPAFEEMGFDLDKSIALFSQFEKVGANPQEVLSSLNIVMTRMAREGATDAEEAFGMLMDEIKDAPDILTATDIAADAFGAKVGGKVADDIRAGHFEVDEWVEALQDADGIVDNTADETETFGEKVKTAMNKATNAVAPFGDTLISSFESALEAALPVIDVVANMAEGFSNMDPALQTTIIAILAVIAAVGPLLAFVGMIAMGISSLIPLLGALGTAFTVATGPVGLIIAAIAAVIAIGVLLYKNWDTIKEKAVEIWTSIMEWFGEVKDWIVDVFTETWSIYKEKTLENWNTIKEFFVEIWEQIKEIFTAVYEWLDEKTDGKFSDIVQFIKEYMTMALDNLKAIWKYIQETFSNATDFLKALVKGDFQGMKDAIQNQMESAKKLISTIWKNIKSFFGGILGDIFGTVVSKFQDIVSSIGQKMGDAYSKVREIWENVMGYFRGIDLLQIGKDIIAGLIKGIASKVNAVKEAVTDVTSAITGKVKSILQISSPSKLAEKFGKWFTEGLGIGIEGEGDSAARKTGNVAQSVSAAMENGMSLPNLDMGTAVQQPSNFGASGSYGGGSTTNEYNYQTLSMDGVFNGAVFNVRDDYDIPKIAKQLNDHVKKGARSKGVVMP